LIGGMDITKLNCLNYSSITFTWSVCVIRYTVFADAVLTRLILKWGHAVEQLIETMRYKPEGGWFHSRWSNWNFSLI
jgi:hypothetical protein